MRKYLALAAAASGLVLTVAAYAAEPMSPATGTGPTTPTAPPAIAASPPPEPGRPILNQVRANGPPIVLEVGKGTLLRLSGPANTVFIANPDVADVTIKTPSLVYLIAKAPGETVLYAVDPLDHVLLNSPVRVEHDLSRVQRGLSSIAPGERVAVSSVDNSLVLNGNVSSAGRAEKVRSLAASIAGETKGTVVNRLGVSTPNQVNIRVRIAEVNRTVLKSLGVNWSKLTGTLGKNGEMSHIGFNTTNPTAPGAAELAVLFGGPSWLTQATVDALVTEGLLTTLAEPNLTAINGQPASFLAGGEFPFSTVLAASTAGGVPVVTTEFKKFGVQLVVVPTIIDPEHLNLKIRAEVSALSAEGATQFASALTSRSAETTVELGSGQSFSLAGLMQNSDQQNVSKVPLLGDIPILGQLFRSQQFQRKETELVIIVTPYLVQPAPTVASLAMPTDGFVPAHDVQQVISGGTYRQTLPPPAKGPAGPGGQGLIGPVGFRLD